MNRFIKQNTDARTALLLLVVLVSSMLIKTSHIVFSGHHHSEESIHIQAHSTVTTNHYQYCAILDFEFYASLAQKKFILPSAIEITRNNQYCTTCPQAVKSLSYLFQLRAPPTV